MTAKVSPQSKECEQGVIGAILLEPDLFEQVLDVIPNQDFFYLKEHQTIFKAAFSLFTKGKRIDLLTVTDELRATNELESVGGAYGLTKIANTIVTTAHVITHAKTVAEKYVLREIIKLGNEAIAKAYEGEDCFELKEQVISNLSSLYEQNSYTVEHISNPIKRSLEDMFKASQSNSFTLGYPSGLRSLDELTNGFQDKQLIVIAARPGVGKTSLAGNFLLNLAKQNIPVGFISLEMSKEEIVKRVLASECTLDLNDINHGRVNFQSVNETAAKIAALPIYFEDKPSISIYGIKTLIRNLVAKMGVKIVLIDYLQLIKGNVSRNKNRSEIVSEIARALKEYAKEYNIPIVALAQLNRQVDKSSQPPKLSDLAESGGIEANADQVIFIHKYEENGITERKLIVEKNRGGKIGYADVKFIGENQKWVDKYQQDFNNYQEKVSVSFQPLINNFQPF